MVGIPRATGNLSVSGKIVLDPLKIRQHQPRLRENLVGIPILFFKQVVHLPSHCRYAIYGACFCKGPTHEINFLLKIYTFFKITIQTFGPVIIIMRLLNFYFLGIPLCSLAANNQSTPVTDVQFFP